MAFGTGDRFVDIGAVVEWLAALRAHASQFGADEEGFIGLHGRGGSDRVGYASPSGSSTSTADARARRAAATDHLSATIRSATTRARPSGEDADPTRRYPLPTRRRMAASISRAVSRSLIACLLSYFRFPLARPSSSFATPCFT